MAPTASSVAAQRLGWQTFRDVRFRHNLSLGIADESDRPINASDCSVTPVICVTPGPIVSRKRRSVRMSLATNLFMLYMKAIVSV